MADTKPMIVLNNEESQIVYYTKGWFKDRTDPYMDLRVLTAKWAGIPSPSRESDCCIILMRLLNKLEIHESLWADIILTMVMGHIWHPDATTPFERFICKFNTLVAHMTVQGRIQLTPFDKSILDR